MTTKSAKLSKEERRASYQSDPDLPTTTNCPRALEARQRLELAALEDMAARRSMNIRIRDLARSELRARAAIQARAFARKGY